MKTLNTFPRQAFQNVVYAGLAHANTIRDLLMCLALIAQFANQSNLFGAQLSLSSASRIQGRRDGLKVIGVHAGRTLADGMVEFQPIWNGAVNTLPINHMAAPNLTFIANLPVSPLVMNNALPHPAARIGIYDIFRTSSLATVPCNPKSVGALRIPDSALSMSAIHDSGSFPATATTKARWVWIFAINPRRHYLEATNYA